MAEIWLVDDADQRVTMRHHCGDSRHALLDMPSFPLGQGLPGRVAATGEPISIEDIAEYPELSGRLHERDFRKWALLPLHSRSRILGVLLVAAHHESALKENHEWRLLRGVQDQIIIALENAMMYDRVQSLTVLAERERIARELHDGMAQVLTYMKAKTQAVGVLLQQERWNEATTQLGQMTDTIGVVYRDVREAVLSLRSRTNVDEGLVNLLAHYIKEFQSLNGLAVMFSCPLPATSFTLTSTQELQVLRIVQEALTNVRQHAYAAKASVTINSTDTEWVVTVEDDGRGFDLQQRNGPDWPRFGLKIMDERARAIGASLELESRIGQGTRVDLRIPRARHSSAAL